MDYYDFWSRLHTAPYSKQICDAAIRRTLPAVFERGWMRMEKVNPVRLLLEMFAYEEARNDAIKQRREAFLLVLSVGIVVVAVLSLPPYSTSGMSDLFFFGKAVAICLLVLLAVHSTRALWRPMALMPRDADFETAVTFCYELNHFLTDLPEATVARFWSGGFSDEMLREEAAKVLTAKVSEMLAAKKEKDRIIQIVTNVGESHLKSKFDSYKRLGLLRQDETYNRFYRRAQREAKAVHVA